jgi:FkbM family methyltransferase
MDHWKRLRRLLGTRVRLESAALSNNSGRVSLRLDESNNGLATIEERNNLTVISDKSSVISRPVTTRTLDSFHFSNISLIKIDVEGHEESVIEGARKTIELNQPAFIIESEDRHNPGAPRRLVATMSRFGYRAFYLQGDKLRDIATLGDKDIDPKNLQDGLRPYVNNFIFLPPHNLAKYDQLKTGHEFVATR